MHYERSDRPGEKIKHPKAATPDWLDKAGGLLEDMLVIGIDPGLVDMVTCAYLGDRRGRGNKSTFRYVAMSYI